MQERLTLSQTQQYSSPLELFVQLRDLARKESMAIASDDLNALTSLLDERHPLEQAINGSKLEQVSGDDLQQIKKVASDIFQQNERNVIELQRRRDDVAKEMKELARQHEWSKGVSRTLGETRGGMHDITA